MKKSFLPITLTLLLVFILLSSEIQITSASNSPSSTDVWWNPNWRYRRSITLTERSGYTLTNFPIEIILDHKGHAQTDGDDIRVVIDGIETPSYVSESNITNAKVVFEVNLTASTTKMIFVYYGNSGVSKPSYPLIPLEITAGNGGQATIDSRVYLKWDDANSWYGNRVVILKDLRIDFDGDNNPSNNNDLLTDYGGYTGGIGRHKWNVINYGLGDYVTYVRTPLFVDIVFRDASLRVYKGNNWIRTTQADWLHIFGSGWDYAKAKNSDEEKIVGGIVNQASSGATIVYFSKTNPSWLALRNSVTGDIIAGVGLNIGTNYNYLLAGKESSAWDRTISFDMVSLDDTNPSDQPNEAQIYWIGDNTNSYSNVDRIATILSNQPLTSIGNEEIAGPHVIIDQYYISDNRADVGSTQTVGFHAKWSNNNSDVINGKIYVEQLKAIQILQDTLNQNNIFFDDFNDGIADGWTGTAGKWSVINGEYFTSLGVVENGISVVNNLTLTDCAIEIKLRFTDAVGFRAGIVFRYTDNEHFYAFVISHEYNKVGFHMYSPEYPEYGIGEEVNYSINLNVDYTLKVEIHGETFTGYLNGQKMLSWTDGTYTIGKVGLCARRTDVFYDNFTVKLYNLSEISTMESVNEYITNGSGWIISHVNSSILGKKIWAVSGVNANGVTYYDQIVENQTLIWDQVNVTLNVESSRINVGRSANITSVAVYGYDGGPFAGTIILNDTVLSQDDIGKKVFKISKVVDSNYGLSAFTTNEVYCIFDRVKTNINIESLTPGSIIALTTLNYEYDNLPVADSKVKVNGILAENLGNGLYRANISSWMPFLAINIESDKTYFEPTTISFYQIALGNILIESLIIVVSIIFVVWLYSKWVRSKKEEALENLLKREGRLKIEDASKNIGLNTETANKLVSKLLDEQKIQGLVLKHNQEFVSERALSDTIRELGRFKFEDLSHKLEEPMSQEAIKKLVGSLQIKGKISGYFTADGEGFVTEDRLKEEMKRGL